MLNLELEQPKEYNKIITNLFSQVEISQTSRGCFAYWTSDLLNSINKDFQSLLKQDIWTKHERLLLESFYEIFEKLDKKSRIKISINNIKKLISLSFGSLKERSELIKDEILESIVEPEELYNYKKVVFILDSISRLLERIKDNFDNNIIKMQYFQDVSRISLILLNVLEYLMENLNDEFLDASIFAIRDIGDKYYELSEIIIEG